MLLGLSCSRMRRLQQPTTPMLRNSLSCPHVASVRDLAATKLSTPVPQFFGTALAYARLSHLTDWPPASVVKGS